MVAAKTYKLRGQAWIVFVDVGSATAAMRAMQGFPFYDKPMKIGYAKTKSDAVAKLDGSFVPRDPAIRQKRKAESREQEKASQVRLERVLPRAQKWKPKNVQKTILQTHPSDTTASDHRILPLG